MDDEKELPAPSETVKRLRETFEAAAATLGPDDEPADVYSLAPVSK